MEQIEILVSPMNPETLKSISSEQNKLQRNVQQLTKPLFIFCYLTSNRVTIHSSANGSFSLVETTPSKPLWDAPLLAGGTENNKIAGY